MYYRKYINDYGSSKTFSSHYRLRQMHDIYKIEWHRISNRIGLCTNNNNGLLVDDVSKRSYLKRTIEDSVHQTNKRKRIIPSLNKKVNLLFLNRIYIIFDR
uniref:Uncharacterized protein n=1 Tax=Rhizophagus irregularis (strain DAOM 181602 / DAOM 197198 / MUCL 43194) TaxID=747089 RepID=U9T7J0_RHIID